MAGSPTRGQWTRERAHEALLEWASTATHFTTASCPSCSAIMRHLDLATSADLWDYVRRHLVGRDDDVVVVRIPCSTWGTSPWRTVTVAAWRDGGCPCDYCTATVGQSAPHLLACMVTPDPGQPMERATEFHCGAGTTVLAHPHTVTLVPAIVGQRTPMCPTCWIYRERYAGVVPGDVVCKPDGAASATEGAVVGALDSIYSGVVERGRAILLRPEDAYPTRTIAPDVILPQLRTVVEIDGGNGQSPDWSRHDTEEGRADDQRRDELLAGLGWSTIRVRHPQALALDSPATVLPIGNRSPRRIAQALADHLATLPVLDNGTEPTGQPGGG